MSPRTKKREINEKSPKRVALSSKATLWNEEEKLILLSALKKYGYTDIENIAKQLPHKSKLTVKTMINKLHALARRTGIMKKNQIDAWLHTNFFNDEDTMIPEALKYISLFEKHPLPEETAGCDFKILYDWLHTATLGQAPINVSQMIQETVFYALNQVTEDVWPRYEGEVYEYIENLERNSERRVYGPKKSL